MARSLTQTIIKLSPIAKPHRPSSRLLSLRTQSNQPNHSDLHDPSPDSSSDPLLRQLEDAIRRIIIRRAAPDWLPFLPGSSYWVPPSNPQSSGLAQLVEKLANPLNPEETMSTTTVRGWPSSEYFIKGGSPHPPELESSSNTSSKSESTSSKSESKSEDEEG